MLNIVRFFIKHIYNSIYLFDVAVFYNGIFFITEEAVFSISFVMFFGKWSAAIYDFQRGREAYTSTEVLNALQGLSPGRLRACSGALSARAAARTARRRRRWLSLSRAFLAVNEQDQDRFHQAIPPLSLMRPFNDLIRWCRARHVRC